MEQLVLLPRTSPTSPAPRQMLSSRHALEEDWHWHHVYVGLDDLAAVRVDAQHVHASMVGVLEPEGFSRKYDERDIKLHARRCVSTLGRLLCTVSRLEGHVTAALVAHSEDDATKERALQQERSAAEASRRALRTALCDADEQLAASARAHAEHEAAELLTMQATHAANMEMAVVSMQAAKAAIKAEAAEAAEADAKAAAAKLRGVEDRGEEEHRRLRDTVDELREQVARTAAGWHESNADRSAEQAEAAHELDTLRGKVVRLEEERAELLQSSASLRNEMRERQELAGRALYTERQFATEAVDALQTELARARAELKNTRQAHERERTQRNGYLQAYTTAMLEEIGPGGTARLVARRRQHSPAQAGSAASSPEVASRAHVAAWEAKQQELYGKQSQLRDATPPAAQGVSEEGVPPVARTKEAWDALPLPSLLRLQEELTAAGTAKILAPEEHRHVHTPSQSHAQSPPHAGRTLGGGTIRSLIGGATELTQDTSDYLHSPQASPQASRTPPRVKSPPSPKAPYPRSGGAARHEEAEVLQHLFEASELLPHDEMERSLLDSRWPPATHSGDGGSPVGGAAAQNGDSFLHGSALSEHDASASRFREFEELFGLAGRQAVEELLRERRTSAEFRETREKIAKAAFRLMKPPHAQGEA